jgi:AbrB family looped-hinge helix DNA binding protein
MQEQHKFLGITTLGEKGQIVIPAEARKRLKLKAGEKLMVMMPHGNAIVLMKASQLETFAEGLTQKLASIKSIIKKHK